MFSVISGYPHPGYISYGVIFFTGGIDNEPIVTKVSFIEDKISCFIIDSHQTIPNMAIK